MSTGGLPAGEMAQADGRIENDIDEIDDDVFDGSAAASKRIYALTRKIIEFRDLRLGGDPLRADARGDRLRMNVDPVPELDYPFALAPMLAVAMVLYGIFKWREWI